MHKIKQFVTKKILRQLRDEAEKDPVGYQKWYEQFQSFIKEGSL
jgi:HSP90 family molecular chaperone